MKKVALISLGCAKNLVDSENMLALISDNFELTQNPEEANVIVINTCGFITSAKEESINTILEMAEYKKTGDCQALIVIGCLVQKYQKELLDEIPEIDVFLGTGNYHEVAETIEQILAKGQRIIRVNNEWSNNPQELPRLLVTPKHYAYVRIAEGCDNFCTYCVIPQMRGPYRSRSQESIINEVSDLVQKGVKEVILIAQDTTQYGKDIYGKNSLAQLLQQLVQIDNLRWIRLLYCYPNNFTDDLIEIIKQEPKICKYLDIPMQHADNSILKKMGRKITVEEIKALLGKLKSKIPEIKIRSTFIVGFPGETAENFNNLLRFIKEMQLDRVGAFQYSQEEDTPAGKMPNQIPEDVKEERLNMLMQLQYNILLEKHRQYIGQQLTVQVDEASVDDSNLWLCRSQGEAPEIDPNILVYSEKKFEPGQMLQIKITHLQDYDFIGEVIRELT